MFVYIFVLTPNPKRGVRKRPSVAETAKATLVQSNLRGAFFRHLVRFVNDVWSVFLDVFPSGFFLVF